MPVNPDKFEPLFAEKMAAVAPSTDPAHDILHFRRVVATAKRLCAAEKGKPEIVVPAAWLHDLVVVPKNDPRRSQASLETWTRAANAAASSRRRGCERSQAGSRR